MFMQRALDLAAKAAEVGEVPVGALVVKDGEVIGEGFNQPISASDPTAHAEVMAMRAAASKQQNYRLPGATLYVTIEPCTMCFGTLIHARIGRVVYGATEPRAGVITSQLQLPDQNFFNHKVQVEGGVMAEEAGALLKDFFRKRR
ncbi:tRNA adenosine(34) deaminase TadA [Microbulbifer agarilyticus]|uniref:tRNA-specific adenosine deaminase n=1 Tax=Microbulbifer agarilyticus TaxID=260552 RepID=A0A1Q2M6M3_9GAMM|nr:tRNA adenosine(34) deaminase TadA [Microbulbifer agarilyticus]AQQ68395.1 tRNA adenosine(34) deaminase TadA [Microbulbifer agarilyticus]